MKELYEEYGRLLIQAEILNNKIAEIKQRIAEELRKPKPEVKEEK